MFEVFSLFLIFQLKHFVADYLLQAPFYDFMKGKFERNGWVIPLASHAGIHSILTMVICMVYTKDFLLSVCLALLDGIIHFVVDRVKASPNMLGRYKIEQPAFWISLGGDQMAHHLTHYLIIFFIWYKMTL
tara:strand:+ start:3194 stop:3586 length:393 start_codon:yes stop_codon:yes gene_type:complete